MATELLDRVAVLAARYAEGVVDELISVDSEQALREGLAGAFIAFYEDAALLEEMEASCRRTGTPGV